MVAVGGVAKRGRADQQARGGRGPQYSRPEAEGKVVQLVRRGERTEGEPAAVAAAGRRRDIRNGIENLEREVRALHSQHALRVEAFLCAWNDPVVAANPIETIDTTGRGTVERAD